MYVDRAAAGRVPRRSTRGLFRLCGAAGSPILPRLMPVHILFYVWVILKLHAIHKPFISGVRGSMTAGTDSRLVLDS